MMGDSPQTGPLTLKSCVVYSFVEGPEDRAFHASLVLTRWAASLRTTRMLGPSEMHRP